MRRRKTRELIGDPRRGRRRRSVGAMRLAVCLAAVLGLMAPAAVQADQIDGDDVATIDQINNKIDFGQVCPGQDKTVAVYVAARRQGTAANVTWKPGEKISVTFVGSNASPGWITATMGADDTIDVPSDWASDATKYPSGAHSADTAKAEVTLHTAGMPVGPLGALALKVTFNGNGKNQNGVSIDRQDDVDLIGSILAPTDPKCAPVLDPPTFTDAADDTACLAGNAVTVNDISWTDPAGAADEPFTVTIDWGDSTSETISGVNALSIDPVTHVYSAGGPYRVSVSVTDKYGVESTPVVSTPFSFLYYTGKGILQPINLSGERSSFTLGSTIPVKVKVTDCDQLPVGELALSVHLARVDGTADTANEVVSSSAADVGNTMRFTGEPDNRYIFNLSTKRSQFNDDQNLVSGSYHIWLTGSGIAQVDAWFDLKR